MGGGAGGLFGGGDDVSPALRLAVGVLLRARAPCARCGEFAGRARPARALLTSSSPRRRTRTPARFPQDW